MKKLIHATLRKKKSLSYIEEIVQKPNPEQLGGPLQILTISGQRTWVKESNGEISEKSEKQRQEMDVTDEEIKRLLDDKGSINNVVNLPKLHESNKLRDDGENSRDLGTIRRPYYSNEELNPLVIQTFSRTKQTIDNPSRESTDSKDTGTLQYSDDTFVAGLVHESREGETSNHIEDNSIAPFPPIEDDEIDKHRHLNEEAERNSKTKTSLNRNQGYLKRLSLERKPRNDQQQKDLKAAKKKTMKRVQTKTKITKDFKDDFFEEKPATPPPKPKEVEAKPVKLILGFRYSYALEQYYRGQMKFVESELSLNGDDLDNSREEVLNGWLVKSLGPNVLNLRARTMPSCNPIELRLRRQQARMRNMSRSRSLQRTLSRDSVLSRALLRSRESVSKLNTIDEGRESRQSNKSLKERKVSINQKVEVMGAGSPNDRSTVTVLPPIYTPENMFPGVAKIKKAISLKLPAIGAEE